MEAREKILLKAHHLFNRFGFRRVTMDEIAAKMGMSKKTIYQTFATKDEIVDAVVEALLKKSVSICEEGSAKAENAIDEIFSSIDMVEELMGEMNPVVLEDLEKFYPLVFEKFLRHKYDYIYIKVKQNLEKGIAEGLYREELNVDVISKFRIETMFLPFNQNLFPFGTYNLAAVKIETIEHFLYGIATVSGQKLIKKYKQKRIKKQII